MFCGRAESRIRRQRSGCGLPALRAGAPRRSQQCPRPWCLALKFIVPANLGASADPKADLNRADELLSQALALDLTNAGVHNEKAWVLQSQGRFEEAIAERERTLALDPGDVSAIQGMAWDHLYLGRFDKSLELFDEAIRLSPRDPELQFMENG